MEENREELQEQLNADRPDYDGDEGFLRNDEWWDVDPAPYLLDFTKPYTAPKYSLSWNGIGFAPLGGIHAMTGQAGNGKTMTLAQMIAAILGGEYGSLRYELEEDIPEPKVLYIDTEMEEANTIAMKNRVLTMTGRNIGEKYDDFIVLMLREASSNDKKINAATMRWKLILKSLQLYKPTVAFIDGLLDVVRDFNDNAECQETIYKCMQCASHYNISLWCLVHQNPGADKLVGHLGSMLERKVTDIFVAKKDKNATTGEATFTIHQMKARGRDVPDWMFKVLPVDGWGRPEQISSAPLGNDDPELIKEWLRDGQLDITWPATLQEIWKIFKIRGKQANRDKLQADATVAKNRRFIIPQDPNTRTKGQKHPKFVLNPEEFTIIAPREDAPF